MNVSLNNNRTCTCFGHRDIEITDVLREELVSLILDLVENKNVSTFYFGGFGDFDQLCWNVVSEIKEKYSFIKRVYCLSDIRHTRPYKRPNNLKDADYEEFIYLDLKFDYWYKRIYFRNCEMINLSDYVIFYVCNTENSGAYLAYKYAKKKNKTIFNLGNIE